MQIGLLKHKLKNQNQRSKSMKKIDKTLMFSSLPVISGPSIKNINYFFTTRQGGISTGDFDSLNLGFNTADTNANTKNNRDRLQARLPSSVPWLNQVHGNNVHIINSIQQNQFNTRPTADAAVTNVAGQVLAIQTADCMPVIIAHEYGLCLGVAHAGWRSLVGGILENTVQTLVNEYGVNPINLVAWIGPCIQQQFFQVGEDVLTEFVTSDSSYKQYFQSEMGINQGKKWRLDLPSLAAHKLSMLGLENTYISGLCTYENDKLFYSYRRNNNTGRQAALAWISV